MKIVSRSNCSGKTKELIRESLDTDIPILVFSESKRKSLEDKSIAYFQQRVKTLNIEEAKGHQGSVMIDDIDEVLQTLVRCATGNMKLDVNTVTLSA